MLSENGEVLCPTAFATLEHAGNSLIDHIGAEKTVTKTHFSETLNTRQVVETNPINPMHESESPIREQLLWLMNNHVMKSNGTALGRSSSAANSNSRCLMWHTPFMFHSDSQESQTISKWCLNCRNSVAYTSTHSSGMIS